MFWIRRWVKEFFSLSHSQANGFIVLVPLLGLIMFSAPLWHWYISGRVDDRSKDLAMLDSLVALWKEPSVGEEVRSLVTDSVVTFFHFDPNRATLEEFQTLGFSHSLATRIDRYRQKGGKFFTKKDLLKIYGIDSSLYQRIHSFIDLPETRSFEKKHDQKTTFKPREVIVYNALLKFDINKADTAQFMNVNGIGVKRSQRIVKYRDALGGFISMDQVKEVFGLDSLVVNKLFNASFIEESFQPVTININTSDEKRLASHPYLSNAAARSIVAYRFQHGEFRTIEELRNIHALDEKTIQKITPYLTLGD